MRLAALLSVPVLVLAVQAGVADAAVVRRFQAAGFRQVELTGGDDVSVRLGRTFSVVATGPAARLSALVAEVRGDTLRIGHNGPDGGDGEPAKVVVTLPNLIGTSVSGSGDMTVAPFRTARFSAAVGGSGDLRLLRVDAVRIDLSVAGSGDLTAAGRASVANLSTAGSGDLDAAALNATTVTASAAGSGNLSARAVARATTSLVGSGDITVHGPARCTIVKVGSGDVHCNAG